HGLMILGKEGVNATVSYPRAHQSAVKDQLLVLFPIHASDFKDSFADKHPFNGLKVKVRDEIVTLGRADLVPNSRRNHLAPDEWNRVLKEEDVVVIDTRNDYEYRIGHFKGAINPNTSEFTEFPKYLKESGISPEKKILIYCTGGIRCEKAILEM